MRNRDLATQKLEILEGRLRVLRNMVVSGSPIEEYINYLSSAEELVSELKSMIDREPAE